MRSVQILQEIIPANVLKVSKAIHTTGFVFLSKLNIRLFYKTVFFLKFSVRISMNVNLERHHVDQMHDAQILLVESLVNAHQDLKGIHTAPMDVMMQTNAYGHLVVVMLCVQTWKGHLSVHVLKDL